MKQRFKPVLVMSIFAFSLSGCETRTDCDSSEVKGLVTEIAAENWGAMFDGDVYNVQLRPKLASFEQKDAEIRSDEFCSDEVKLYDENAVKIQMGERAFEFNVGDWVEIDEAVAPTEEAVQEAKRKFDQAWPIKIAEMVSVNKKLEERGVISCASKTQAARLALEEEIKAVSDLLKVETSVRELSLSNIRLQKKDEQKTLCAATLDISHPKVAHETSIETEYTVQKNTDGELYVEASRANAYN